jgi:putative tricarboxylic transport membrane protein
MDRIGAVLLMVFGGFWIWQAGRLAISSPEGGPGPGLLPTAMGISVVVLAALSFLRPEVERIALPHVGRIALILVSLIGYALLLEELGYLIATALLLGFLLLAFAERRRWWQPVAAVVVSFATYYVFRILLQVPLPTDPLDLVR